jgi:multicomponent K+:H+ antiporter subunit E
MKRIVTFPLASAGLVALWLLLNQTFSPGHLLLGGVVALVGGWLLAALELPKARLRRLSPIARLAGFVAADIVRSNVAVALIVLGLKERDRTLGFVHIPLELRQPYGLAILACIITSTPGTLWVLDLIDESQWIRTIKGRYESLLLEIYA